MSAKYFRQPTRILLKVGLPRWQNSKESPCQVGDSDLFPGLRRSPGKGNGNPLQYSCLENPMDGGGWWGYSPWGRKESDITYKQQQINF